MEHSESLVFRMAAPDGTAPSIALLACDVLKNELTQHQGGARIVETRFFEMGLHDHPGKLRAILQEHLAAVDARTDIDAVVLAYGLCGLGVVGLEPLRHRLVIPRAHDCITLFMGSKEAYAAHQKAHAASYYFTPGWNRGRRVPGPEALEALRRDFAEKYDAEDLEYLVETTRGQWAQHDTAAYVDLGTPDAEAEAAYAQGCARWLGWNFERIAGDPTLLRDLLCGPWDAERFEVVEPGRRLEQALDGGILRSSPGPGPEHGPR